MLIIFMMQINVLGHTATTTPQVSTEPETLKKHKYSALSTKKRQGIR